MFSAVVKLLIIFSIDHYFQCAYSQSIPLVVEVWDESLTNDSVDRNENQLEDVTRNCSQALEEFAEAVTNLTRCTVLNARPIRICTSCHKEMNSSEAAYRQLKMESSDCHEFYFENDGIGIVNLVYKQGTDLWLKSNCQDCYNDINATNKFFKISKNLDDCMKKSNKTSTEGPNDVCHMCEALFVGMNDIYKKFVQGVSSDESAGVCRDIIDQMNITRHIWAQQDCLKFDSNIGYPNIITCVVVGCIPVFFYMLSKSISNIEDVKLVRPKRKSFASLHSESLPID